MSTESARKSVCLRGMFALLSLWLMSIPARAQVWTQTDWSGGPGQPSWSDTTRYYTGTHVDGWTCPGDLRLGVPDDSNWFNTGNLAGAFWVYCLVEASDGAVYAGTGPNGDVFKSVDAGTTWVNCGDLAGAANVRSLAEASDGALYAGTGPNGDVFKSVDAGTAWVNTGALVGVSGIHSLIEALDGTIYAGTWDRGEVFKSVDAGTIWVNCGNLPGAANVHAVLEASDGAIYAGTGRTAGNVFKSVDAGTSWANTGNLSGADNVYCLVEASDGALYAGTAPNGDVFKSANAGTTWVNTGALVGATEVYSLMQASRGAVYAGTHCSGDTGRVFKSTDGGTTWVNTGSLAGANEVHSLLQTWDEALHAGAACAAPDYGSVFKAGHFSYGDLVSSVYETENLSVSYGIMTWNETLNSQTLAMKVRTDTLSDMSTAPDWGVCPYVVNGEDISNLSSVDDRENYVQYRVELLTTSPQASPVLHEVSIEYAVDLDGPVADSAVASDRADPIPGIDDDDFVVLFFDERTGKPRIDALNIDAVLFLSGGHSWLDGFGSIDSAYWNPFGDMLVVELSTFLGLPTVAVGDTVTPDGVTITDIWGNPCTTQVVISGSFDPVGVGEVQGTSPEANLFSLSKIWPNPAAGPVEVRYTVPIRSAISISLYDACGRSVRTLIDEDKEPGVYAVRWDGKDHLGREVASGLYFCRLAARHTHQTEGASGTGPATETADSRTGVQQGDFATATKVIVMP